MWGCLSVHKAAIQWEPTGALTCWSSSRKSGWKALGTISVKYAPECSREMHVQNVVLRNLLINPKNVRNEQIVEGECDLFSDGFCWGSFQSWCSAHGAVLEVRLISLLELNMEGLF